MEYNKHNFAKYPGMKVGLFKRSDGNGGTAIDWASIAEKFISGILIVVATTALNWYVSTIKLEARIDRLENAVVKVGKYMWSHVAPNPNTPCPFDDFEKK